MGGISSDVVIVRLCVSSEVIVPIREAVEDPLFIEYVADDVASLVSDGVGSGVGGGSIV